MKPSTSAPFTAPQGLEHLFKFNTDDFCFIYKEEDLINKHKSEDASLPPQITSQVPGSFVTPNPKPP